jgi:hypothetical protein
MFLASEAGGKLVAMATDRILEKELTKRRDKHPESAGRSHLGAKRQRPSSMCLVRLFGALKVSMQPGFSQKYSSDLLFLRPACLYTPSHFAWCTLTWSVLAKTCPHSEHALQLLATWFFNMPSLLKQDGQLGHFHGRGSTALRPAARVGRRLSSWTRGARIA